MYRAWFEMQGLRIKDGHFGGQASQIDSASVSHLRAELQVVISQDLHECSLAEAGETYSVRRSAITLDHSLKVAAQKVPRKIVQLWTGVFICSAAHQEQITFMMQGDAVLLG